MRTAFIKLFVISTPFLFLIFIYIIKDPFKVLYKYNIYVSTKPEASVLLNKDIISTETFLSNYKKYNYDSYIFGNSRSMFYTINEWEKHIHASQCFHFDAHSETLFGVEKKVELIHNKNCNIKNALFVWDVSLLQVTTNSEGHLYMKDPNLSGENAIAFQLDNFKDYIDLDFIKEYIPFVFFKKIYPDTRVFLANATEYNPVTNEISWSNEQKIEKNKDEYYNARMNIFYRRDSIQQYSPQVIQKDQKDLLLKIKKILDHDQTNYRIVISPLYDQKKLDTTDLEYLYNLFGKENVYDFSGINDITKSIYNYYEASHYRSTVASRIIDSIYSNNRK
jgi:hypothetical protein